MFLTLKDDDNRPIYQQIISQIREQVGNGTLQPGQELPSVREVADSLDINMHTVRSAYLKLRDQGIISMRLGRRARILRQDSPVRDADLATDIEVRLKELVTDALLAGFTPDELRRIVHRQLEKCNEDNGTS